MYLSRSAKLAVSVCHVLYLARCEPVIHMSTSLYSFNSHFEECSKLELIHFLICILLVTAWLLSMRLRRRRLGPPLLFRTFAGMVRMQGRETWEVGKQLLDVWILIIWLLMSPSIGRHLRSILLNLRCNPLYILTPPRFRPISKFIHITLEFYIFIV